MNYMFTVYLTHILFVAPLFVYLWYVSTYQNKKISDNLGILLLVMGISVFIYHLYKLIRLYKIMS